MGWSWTVFVCSVVDGHLGLSREKVKKDGENVTLRTAKSVLKSSKPILMSARNISKMHRRSSMMKATPWMEKRLMGYLRMNPWSPQRYEQGPTLLFSLSNVHHTSRMPFRQSWASLGSMSSRFLWLIFCTSLNLELARMSSLTSFACLRVLDLVKFTF